MHEYPIVYAAKSQDPEIVKKSSSGGMFTVLSDWFIERGYPVACSVFNYETNRPEFRMLSEAGQRDQARGSKYTQSTMQTIFREAETYLKQSEENRLLFVGTGCQAAAFMAYMEQKHLREQVTAVDLICHGVPSPRLLQDYLKHLTGGRIDRIEYKDKRKGWEHPTALIEKDGKEILLNRKFFYHAAAIRPSCNQCPYTSVNRRTDLTIGDFWGIAEKIPELYDPDGVSLVLIHTPAGEALFEAVRGHLLTAQSNVEDCMQPNLMHPTPRSRDRELFWRDYTTRSFAYNLKKYGSQTVLAKIRRNLQRIFK